jgi:2-oxoglutarate dehydrogenase E2 component (dihydrolipoamide succinyltransferase)
MIVEVKIPSPGESITEVEIASWHVEDGDIVSVDQEIAEIESDKATLPLLASTAGKIKINIAEGESAEVGAVACTIDTDAAGEEPKAESATTTESKLPDTEVKKSEPAVEVKESKPDEASDSKVKISPVAKSYMKHNNISVDDVINGLHRLSRSDVEMAVTAKENVTESTVMGNVKQDDSPEENQVIKMTSLRKKISERLVAVKNETAMLTTFNEVDMSAVMELRSKYGKKFMDKHGVKLGFMSFFTKAVTLALKEYPMVHGFIEDENIVIPAAKHIGMAVQTPKGLMVPVVRNADKLTLDGIEKEIAALANKARTGKITINELNGASFTITNGGVFGSMMSTPILNPPQSAILGLHAINDRPVAVDKQVVVRPMMYIALSYDHRIIDGRDSVGFLVKIKQLIENPLNMLLPSGKPEDLLLDL